MRHPADVGMVRPLRRSDLVAGLPLYDPAGEYLGISTGPPEGDLVQVCDERGVQPRLLKAEWRETRIGDRPPPRSILGA